MGQVDININSKGYRIACEDGEEDRIRRLASMVDAHVSDLVEQVGQIGDNRLLVMASLLIADEFMDLRDVRDGDDDSAGSAADTADAPGDAPALEMSGADEEKLVAAFDALSSRIETIAETLEAT